MSTAASTDGAASAVSVAELIESARRIEPLPASVHRLTRLVADPDSRLLDVVDAVSMDPALASALLRLANSPFCGSRSTIITVHEAVVRLGMERVHSLAMSIAVHGKVGRLASPTLALRVWRHSVAAMIAAEELRTLLPGLPAETTTTALLHDVGTLVLATALTPNVVRMVESAADLEGISEPAAERRVLGIDHAEVGAIAAESWRLPDSIVDGIRHHHDEAHEVGDFFHLGVALADALAEQLGVDEETATADPPDWTVSPRVADLGAQLGVTPVELHALAADTCDKLIPVLAQYTA